MQCWDKIANSWFNASLHYVTALNVEIRIKPEPRRFWAAKATQSGHLFDSEKEANAFAQMWNNHEIIELVEVLK